MYMKLVKMAEQILEEIKSAKRVNHLPFNEDELKHFLEYVDYINHEVGDYTTSIDNVVDGDNFKIPTELKGLFYPARVVYNTGMDRSCINLIVKTPDPFRVETVDHVVVRKPIDYDYARMVQFINKLYATFRKSPSFSDSIMSVRTIVSLSEYVESAAYADNVRANYNQLSIPCPLSIQLYEDYVYNMSVKDYCIIAIRNIIRELAN